MSKIRVDSKMRAAFTKAYNSSHPSSLKQKVARKLRTNRGVLFMRKAS
jgi:hypothetical protein